MAQQHSPDALRYDNVREGEIQLGAEEQALFLKQMQAFERLLADKRIVAKYKIEILFGKARSTSRPTPGALSIWASGAKLHGGGDDKLYICPGKRLKRNECEALLQSTYNASSGIVCPICGTIWKHEDVIGELMFNLSMRQWADVIYRYYRLCEYNADIYLKHARDDIRTAALAQVAKTTWKGTQALERAREKRARHIYPLRNIIKDTSAGANPLTRFYAFLTA